MGKSSITRRSGRGGKAYGLPLDRYSAAGRKAAKRLATRLRRRQRNPQASEG